MQYAFIEFETEDACQEAFFKMQNVLIDNSRIHIDFSQSVAKLWNKHSRSRNRKQEYYADLRGRDNLDNSSRSSSEQKKERKNEETVRIKSRFGKDVNEDLVYGKREARKDDNKQADFKVDKFGNNDQIYQDKRPYDKEYKGEKRGDKRGYEYKGNNDQTYANKRSGDIEYKDDRKVDRSDFEYQGNKRRH